MPLLAQTHDCCAWVDSDLLFDEDVYAYNEEFDFCGSTYEPGFLGGGDLARVGGRGDGGGGDRGTCCAGGTGGE